MAGQGFLGNLYYSITGEDKLEEILRKDKKLAEELNKITGNIKIGRTTINRDYLKSIQAEAKAQEKLISNVSSLEKINFTGNIDQLLTRLKEVRSEMDVFKELQRETSNPFKKITIGNEFKKAEAEAESLMRQITALENTMSKLNKRSSIIPVRSMSDERELKMMADFYKNEALQAEAYAKAQSKAAAEAEKLARAQERVRNKQSAGEFEEYIRSLTQQSDVQKQMSVYYRELEKESKVTATAAGSIKMLEVELKKLKDAYRSLAETDRNSPIGQTMLKQINDADKNLAEINAKMANNAALAKTMGTQYNGLRTQIGMVARELPNLGISLSTFIISLSNNLPYLADEIAKARKEVDLMNSSGQKATPVWKQMIGAIFNWQTALIVGVTVLTAYSREIQAWVQELIEGIDAASELAKTQKTLNELHDNAAKKTAKETAELELLYGATQDTTRTIQERTAAAEKLQQLFPNYFGNLRTETILVGNAQRAYELLTSSIEDAAKASLLQDRYAELKNQMKEATKDKEEATKKIVELNKKLNELENTNDIWGSNTVEISNTVDYINFYTKKLEKANDSINAINQSFQLLQNNYQPKLKPETEILFKDMSEINVYRKTIENLDRSLGMSEITQEEYNKKVNEAKGVLIAAADAAKIGGSGLEELRNEYIAFNKIELIKKSQKSSDNEAENIYKRQQDYIKASKALQDAVSKGERDIEQTRINLMEEGGEKQLAQLKLNFQKRMDAVSKQTDEYVKMVQDQELKEWKKNNPAKKESEYSYKTVDYKTLPKELQDIINEMIEIENQLYEKSIQDYFDSVAKGFRGYLEKREAVEKEFAEKRKTLVQSGASQSSISELDYQEEETLQKIDLEFAQRQQNFQAWANQITSMSLEQLRRLLIEAQFELSKMEKLHPENGDALAEYRAKVTTLRDQIDKIEITPNKKGKDANEEWQELYKTLNEINGSFQEIGNTVGGTAGEIIKTAGKIASSTLQIVKGIQTLAQNSAAAIQGTAIAASTAISTVEKASVILAIISAALQVAMAIVNLFKKDDYMEKFRKEMTKLNYELFLFKINSKIDEEKGSIFGDDNWKNAIKNIEIANDALIRYNETLSKIAKRRKYEGPEFDLLKIENINEQYSSLNESLANMQVQTRHSTWFRKSKYESLKDAVPELFDADGNIDMVALEKFVGSGTFSKLSEQNQAYLQKMADDWKIYQDAVDSVKSYLSDIFGDFGNTISDALVDAFKNGTDAAQKFTDSVSEMIENLATQMIYAISIGPILEEAEKDMLDVMKDQSLTNEEKFAKFASIMDKTTDNLISGQEDYNMLLEQWKQIAKEKGIEIFQPDSEKQNTLSKGIQGVTEDTAGAIGSYMSAMRADLSVNRINLQTLVDNAIPFFNDFALRVADLKHLETIANNTGRNADVAQRILDRLVAMTTAGSATKVNIK